MTEAEARAIPVGGAIKEINGPGLGTITEKHIDFFSIRWSAPRVEGVSTFLYEDCKLLQSGVISKSDGCAWGSWSMGDGLVGANLLNVVNTNDTIFASKNGIGGPPWANLQWMNLKIGSKIKIWDGASTIWQYWTCTIACIDDGSRYRVDVTGSLLLIPPGGLITCTHEY